MSRGRCRCCGETLPLVPTGRALKVHTDGYVERCPGTGLMPAEMTPGGADWRARALIAEAALAAVQSLRVGPDGIDPVELGRALDIAS